MRSRTNRTLLVVALCAGALAVSVAWTLSDRGADAGSLAPAREIALAPAIDAEASARAAAAEAERTSELERVTPLAVASPRSLGVVPPPPDTLVALRGRVLDAESDEPLAG